MTLHEKLIKVQSALSVPKGQKNTFGNYKYRSCEDILEALKPLLKQEGLTLTLTDEIIMLGTRFYVKAIATLTDGENETCVHSYAREEESRKGMDGSQITGSASSYARKYALNGLFCIDDTKDADATNNHEKEEEPKRPYIKKVPPNPWAPDDQLQEITKLTGELGGTMDALYKTYGIVGKPTKDQANTIIATLHLKKAKIAKELDSIQ